MFWTLLIGSGTIYLGSKARQVGALLPYLGTLAILAFAVFG